MVHVGIVHQLSQKLGIAEVGVDCSDILNRAKGLRSGLGLGLGLGLWSQGLKVHDMWSCIQTTSGLDTFFPTVSGCSVWFMPPNL